MWRLTTKALLLNSGGFDTLAVFAWAYSKAAKNCKLVGSLFVDYGQSVSKEEYLAAKRLAKFYRTPLYRADLRMPFWAKMYEENENSYVSGRNAVLLSMAASMAEPLGADTILTGFRKEDSGHSDATPLFARKMGSVFQEASKLKIRVFSPFSRERVHPLEYCLERGAPISMVRSCLKSGSCGCKKCASFNRVAMVVLDKTLTVL